MKVMALCIIALTLIGQAAATKAMADEDCVAQCNSSLNVAAPQNVGKCPSVDAARDSANQGVGDFCSSVCAGGSDGIGASSADLDAAQAKMNDFIRSADSAAQSGQCPDKKLQVVQVPAPVAARPARQAELQSTPQAIAQVCPVFDFIKSYIAIEDSKGNPGSSVTVSNGLVTFVSRVISQEEGRETDFIPCTIKMTTRDNTVYTYCGGSVECIKRIWIGGNVTMTSERSWWHYPG